MKTKILYTALLSTMAMSAQAAVSLSQTGKGDMLILPYYSVKNNMNTTFSVVNHNPTQGKLIQVAFKESKNNYDVLFYNVFLQPNSSWSLGLAAQDSGIPGHIGEPSVVQYHNSTQCAPFLSPIQEFLPYAYEAEDSSSLSLERAQEGHIEIYEIGSFDPSNDELQECGSISQSISQNESFINAHLSAPSGEISATASLLNVSEGASYSYNGIAFSGFSDSNTFDFDEAPYYYDFNDASKTATIIQNGQTYETMWSSGAESINALISSAGVDSDFTVESSVNAQTELVLSFPGKIFMNTGSEAIAPFTQVYNSASGSCEMADVTAFDRGGNEILDFDNLNLCWANNVIKISAQIPTELSVVLNSQHEQGLTPSNDAGRVHVSFNQKMQSLNGIEVNGLPVLGFAVQRLTNANAEPGLMAQYGSLFNFSLSKSISAQ